MTGLLNRRDRRLKEQEAQQAFLASQLSLQEMIYKQREEEERLNAIQSMRDINPNLAHLAAIAPGALPNVISNLSAPQLPTNLKHDHRGQAYGTDPNDGQFKRVSDMNLRPRLDFFGGQNVGVSQPAVAPNAGVSQLAVDPTSMNFDQGPIVAPENVTPDDVISEPPIDASSPATSFDRSPFTPEWQTAKGADGFLYYTSGPNVGERVIPGAIKEEMTPTLRKDYVNNWFKVKTAPHLAIKNSAARIRKMLKLKTGVADTSVLFELVKLFDPGSVVRASEQELLAAASPLVGRVQEMATKMQTGEVISPARRREILQVVDGIVDIFKMDAQQKVTEQRSLWQAVGGDMGKFESLFPIPTFPEFDDVEKSEDPEGNPVPLPAGFVLDNPNQSPRTGR